MHYCTTEPSRNVDHPHSASKPAILALTLRANPEQGLRADNHSDKTIDGKPMHTFFTPPESRHR